MGKKEKKQGAEHRKDSFWKRLLFVAEVPRGLWGPQAMIEMNGNRQVTVEGYKNILEYEPDRIKLNLGKLSLRVLGSGLQIKLMQGETMVIEGFIVSVEYMN